jgi:ABC-type uncharacterized transport system substrate-binding protein
MGRKAIVILVVGLALASVHLAGAQQTGKIPRIGFVSSSGDANNPGPRVNGFRRGLRDLGYTEGKNILVEYRYIAGQSDRVPSIVADLVQLKLDVLVFTSLSATRAAKQATKTIPIVMAIPDDPVKLGLADSLAHPGGNVTGLTRLTRDLSGKRLELLTEVVSHLTRVGILWAPSNRPIPGWHPFEEYEAPARALKIALQILEVNSRNLDLESAFRDAVKARVNALIVVTTSRLVPNEKKIAELAIKHRLVSMFEASHYVEAGGLMSYSADDAESFRRAAIYVDKILKGAKPGDLPIEQAMKFELVINLKAAKQIGLKIPPNVLARADRVIK